MIQPAMIMTCLIGLGAFAPTAVYFEEQKALQNIKAEKKIKDWDFGTSSFYAGLCNRQKLNYSQTCKDAHKAIDDYHEHRGNVKILGY